MCKENMSPMSLKLERLNLNDEYDSSEPISESHLFITDIQVVDDVVLLWKEEPQLEDLELEELHNKLIQRNPNWSLSVQRLKAILTSHSLYATDQTNLFTYSDMVTSTKALIINESLLSKIDIRTNSKGKGLYAKTNLQKGELLFEESTPLVFIPPMDKLSLINCGKSCGLCGVSLTQDSHFNIVNNLDCERCNTVWCSKTCKKLDTSHSILRHVMSKNRMCNTKAWMEFEEFCKKHMWHAAYAIGIIYARNMMSKSDDNMIWEQFNSIAGVSQAIRFKSADSTNIGGTFDALSGVTTSCPQDIWETGCKLFSEVFPNIKNNDQFSLENFLILIGKFNINQIAGQIYILLSHLNHNCEPNVHFEICDSMGVKVYARKDILKGEELFITYVNPLHGVNLRRRELRVNWGFLCDCKRCKKELLQRQNGTIPSILESNKKNNTRRKSSIHTGRPSVMEMLENGQEFDLDVPSELGFANRRKSVRFDKVVLAAI